MLYVAVLCLLFLALSLTIEMWIEVSLDEVLKTEAPANIETEQLNCESLLALCFPSLWG